MIWLMVSLFVLGLVGCSSYHEPCNSDEAVREITRSTERYLAVVRENDGLRLQLKAFEDHKP